MAKAIYDLSLYNLEGKKATGTLSFSIADKDEIPAGGKLKDMSALYGSDERTTTVALITVLGSFTSAEILGNQLCNVNGCMFVSLAGPPLTTILTGNGTSAVGLQFNIIDSPGTCIGGALQIDDSQPWCFLGTLKSE